MTAVRSQRNFGVLLSLILHGLLLFSYVHEANIQLEEQIIPIGLKIIPSIEKDNKIVPITPKKPTLVKKVLPKKEQKVVKKVELKRVGKKDGKLVSLKERYLYELKLFIEQNKIYPKKARRLRQQGQVIVEINIDANGKFQNLKLAKSSSFRSLDSGAIKMLEKIAAFKPLPEALNLSNLKVSQAIVYEMN